MPDVAERALDEKAMHEAGYRYTWPPLIDNLTLREYRKIQLARLAESYIKKEQREAHSGGSGTQMSSRHYNKAQSRHDWAQKHKGGDKPSAT